MIDVTTSTLTREDTLAAELAAARAEIAALKAQVSPFKGIPRPVAELLATTVANAPIVLWCVDREGRFTLSQGRGLEPLGLQPGQAVGFSAWELYREAPVMLDQLHRAMNGEEVSIKAHFAGLVYESWVAPMRDDNDEIIGVVGVATDVTACSRVEEAGSDFLVRLQRVFECSPAGIMLSEFATGKLIDINPAVCHLLERERDDIIGKTSIEVGFWKSVEERQQALTPERLAQCGSSTLHRLRTVQGHTRFVECRGDLIMIEGTRCLLTVVLDVTERERNAKMLRRSRRRFKALTRFAPVGIFRCMPTGHVVDTNRQLLRLWDIERADLTQREWWNIVHPEDRESVVQCWTISLREKMPFATEFRLQSDEERWCFAQADPSQHAGGIVVTATDITAQKRSEHALQRLNEELESRVTERTAVLVNVNKILEEQIYERRLAVEELEASREKWRSLVQNAPDIILLINRAGEITFLNHTHSRPELQVDEVVGNSVYDFIFPEFNERIRTDLVRVFDHGESLSHEVAGPDKHGDRLWFQSHIAPVWRNGEVVSATIVCRDITRQHRAAEELKQKQDQLIHVSRVSMVGEMTAAIAHEMFQPLQAISGYVNGCIRRLSDNQPVTDDLLSTLQEAVDEAHRAGEIVKRMKQFLQRNELKCEPVTVRDLFHDVARLGEPAVRRGGSHCHIEPPDPSWTVSVDRIQMVQVLLNLVLNAVEAMEAVIDELREIHVAATCPSPDMLEMTVCDNGPGLPSELGEQIFEAFVTTKSAGLGMGLSISRSIVEGHGGKLLAQHAPHGGAMFVIRLPLREPVSSVTSFEG